MRARRRIGRVAVNGLLLVGVAGLLVAYLVVVNDLPSRVYTSVQREYLAYNAGRSLAQAAPTWNVLPLDSSAVPTSLPGQDSQVRAVLVARYEEQDGVSVTVYDLEFRGQYRLVHSGAFTTTVQVFFPFPANLETLHEVAFLVDDAEPAGVQYGTHGINWQGVMVPGEAQDVEIRYKADGANSFSYGLHQNQRADVDVEVKISQLTGCEVPRSSLPASERIPTEGGEVWRWRYAGLIPDRDIRLNLPTRLSFAQRVAQLEDDYRLLAGLAPLLVGLFVALLAGAMYLGGVQLGFESYLLAGFGLALFYPLLTFASGVVDLGVAAAVAVTVVVGLQVTFLGLTAGWRAAWRAGLLLVILLGFLSLGLLAPWRGLLLTVGGLLLVGTFMVLYATRKAPSEPEVPPEPLTTTEPPEESDPAESAGSPLRSDGEEPTSPAEPEIGETAPDVEVEEEGTEVEIVQTVPPSMHCPFCARALEDDYGYCPGCGRDVNGIQKCPVCGHRQLVSVEAGVSYCVQCGESLDLAAREAR